MITGWMSAADFGGSEAEGSAKSDLVPVSELLPTNLPLLPVAQTTLFPGMIVPLVIPEGKLAKTVDFLGEGAGYVGIVVYKTTSDSGVATGPSTSLTGLPVEGTVPADKVADFVSPRELFHSYGVAAKILKRINLPDNQVSILVAGLQRFEINSIVSTEPHYVASVDYLYERLDRNIEFEALLRGALSSFKQLSKENPLITEEMKLALVNIDGPGKLADFMASVLVKDIEDYQKLVAAADVKARLRHLLVLLKKEQDVQAVQKKMQDEINSKVATAQREFYLQEQLKIIQRELGKTPDDRTKVTHKFSERLKAKKLSVEAKARIDEEFEKLASIPEQSSEYSVSVNYLDWATSLPWGVRTEENSDLHHAKLILDEDHYGLKDAKERILEFLAVKKLKKSASGSIICFVGPPGTGKTSLGKSIARALGRKFFRFSVGGMRDEAEIKGHRRTYVGAMPGKLIQGLKRVGSQNPVFLIDEIDKIGSSVLAGGDPASALLEMLDPEQNPEFLDHYLDIPFDCSEVFFVTTANSTDTIPAALLDRMEVIQVSGYTDTEKFQIAKRHLIPKLFEKNSVRPKDLSLSDVALRHVISHYARESGVRNLEKQLAKIVRKGAYRIALGRVKHVEVGGIADVEKLLGVPPYVPEMGLKEGIVGVSTGLAWTQLGGEVLLVESRVIRGKGGFTLTGQLGEVMRESATIAYSFIREYAIEHLKYSPSYFESHNFHVHVPAGAIPKDGPSAGITLAASLYSLLSGKVLDPTTAMTGELTLTGRVLPVGGIKEKLLAAKRANIKRVLLPHHNGRDLKEIDSEIKQGIKILQVSTIEEALKSLFLKRRS